MNQAEIVKKLADKLEVTQNEARKAYTAVVDIITEEVRTSEDKDIHIPGLVVFVKKAKEAYTAKNPATGESIEVPAHTRLTARPVKSLKTMVRGGSSIADATEADTTQE